MFLRVETREALPEEYIKEFRWACLHTYPYKPFEKNQMVKKKDFNICRCDICGNEFTEYTWNKELTYAWGRFVAGKYASVNDQYSSYNLGKDLCDSCMSKFINKLNAQLEEIVCKDNILKQLEEMKE